MTDKRFTIRPQDDYFGVNDCLQEFNVVNGIRTEIEAKWLCDLLNEQHETIEELKQEVEMLINGLKAYDEALPLFLDCEDIMHFHSELFEFKMKRMDFYKEHPNRVHYSDRRD